jgi:RNA recognition motif-containing protein
VCDPRTGDSRGFAFVTMGSDTEAQDAMEGGNRTELDGRIISVEKVHNPCESPPSPPSLSPIAYIAARRTHGV